MKPILSTIALLLSVVTSPAPTLTATWTDNAPGLTTGFILTVSNSLGTNQYFASTTTYTWTTNIPPTNVLSTFTVQATNAAGISLPSPPAYWPGPMAPGKPVLIYITP